MLYDKSMLSIVTYERRTDWISRVKNMRRAGFERTISRFRCNVNWINNNHSNSLYNEVDQILYSYNTQKL